MDKELAVQSLTDTMAKFTAYIGKRLPKDVKSKLIELKTLETNPLAKSIYDSMDENQIFGSSLLGLYAPLAMANALAL